MGKGGIWRDLLLLEMILEEELEIHGERESLERFIIVGDNLEESVEICVKRGNLDVSARNSFMGITLSSNILIECLFNSRAVSGPQGNACFKLGFFYIEHHSYSALFYVRISFSKLGVFQTNKCKLV